MNKILTAAAAVLAAIVICLAFAGCGHAVPPEPEIKVVEAKVVVTVPCKTNISLDDQKYPDNADVLRTVPHPTAAARLARNNADVEALLDQLANLHYTIKVVLAGRLLRNQREKELVAAVRECKKE